MKLFQEPKAGAAVAAYTATVGAGTAMDTISSTLGLLGVILGIILTTVLIVNHWRIGRANYDKLNYEIKLLKERESRRKMRAEERTKLGLPTRRADD